MRFKLRNRCRARHRNQDCLLPKGVSPAGPVPRSEKRRSVDKSTVDDVMMLVKLSTSANQRSIAIILNMLSS